MYLYEFCEIKTQTQDWKDGKGIVIQEKQKV